MHGVEALKHALCLEDYARQQSFHHAAFDDESLPYYHCYKVHNNVTTMKTTAKQLVIGFEANVVRESLERIGSLTRESHPKRNQRKSSESV